MSTKRQQPTLLPYDGPYVRAFEVMRELAAWPTGAEQGCADRLASDGCDPDCVYRVALVFAAKFDPRRTKYRNLPLALCNWAIGERDREQERSNGGHETLTAAEYIQRFGLPDGR